jgi:hypothetical protein
LATTRRSRLQLSRVVQVKSLKRRAGVVWVGEEAWPRSWRTDIRCRRASTGTCGSEAVIEATRTTSMSVVNISQLAGILPLFLVAVTPVRAADNLSVERLATCQDSWRDWKNSDPVRLKRFAQSFQSDFLQKEKDPFFVPKSNNLPNRAPLLPPLYK